MRDQTHRSEEEVPFWRKGWNTIWRIVLFFLIFGVCGAPFFLLLDSFLKEWADEFPARAHLYAQAGGAAAILAATWVMTRFVDRRPFRSIGFAWETMLAHLAVGLGVGLAWLVLSLGPLWAAGWALFTDAPGPSLQVLVLAGVATFFNVVTQQLLLCGYILQTLHSRFGFVVASIVSALLFTAYHAGAYQDAVLPAVNVFAAGLFFCLAYAVSGNLWLPIGMHFAWNFLLGPVLGLTMSGIEGLGEVQRVELSGPVLFTGGDFGLEGGLAVMLTTTAGIVAMVLWRRSPWKILSNPAEGGNRT